MSKQSRDEAKRRAALTDEERSIEYMSAKWNSPTFTQHEFLGFIPTLGEYHWGTMIYGKQQVAVHIFRTPDGWDWGDNHDDSPEFATANPYVLMFYGIDNSSYYMRFPTKQEGLEAYEILKDGIRHDEKGLMFYNS